MQPPKKPKILINALNKYETPFCKVMYVHYRRAEKTNYMKEVVIQFKGNNYSEVTKAGES